MGNKYKETQEKTRQQLITEKSEKVKKRVTRDPAAECIIIKDKNGNRHFEPNTIKENIATYYEDLYKNRGYLYHPYHDELKRRTNAYLNNFEYENEYYNTAPPVREINEIIEQKKNGKSTTDIKNEMIKRPGENMVNFLQPLIRAIW